MKKYDNILKQLITKTKAEYYRKKINSFVNNPDQLWKILWKLDLKTQIIQPTSLVNEVERKVTDERELTEVFNEFFWVWVKSWKKNENNGVKFRHRKNVNYIVILETEEAEVLKIIHSLYRQ